MTAQPAADIDGVTRADGLLRRLVEAGERITGPREAVARALYCQDGAINPETVVYQLRPRIGRAAVYRTLDILKRHGMVERLHSNHGHAYTLCERGHHHHLLCNACGRVVRVDALQIEVEIRRLADRLHVRLETHTLEFTGVCAACEAKVAERPEPPFTAAVRVPAVHSCCTGVEKNQESSQLRPGRPAGPLDYCSYCRLDYKCTPSTVDLLLVVRIGDVANVASRASSALAPLGRN
jgi:Fur family ferric uptake transcriptional regulator